MAVLVSSPQRHGGAVRHDSNAYNIPAGMAVGWADRKQEGVMAMFRSARSVLATTCFVAEGPNSREVAGSDVSKYLP